ncbi:hypothetical protein J4210_01790 [Candidatus Woesearchaeota archaeon]|nr:hypothetical protein [Candidatus Woesearchaeota archaeon]
MAKKKVKKTVKKKTVVRTAAGKKPAKKEYFCPHCGYEAFKLARLSSCPLCVICSGCGKEVRKCRCKEGE